MLKKYLEECKAAYYAGTPIISDSQYDALEEAYSAETQIGTNKGRVKHWYKMYSLQKVYDIAKSPFNEFLDVVQTPKLDGAAIALRYIKGELHSVVTRGNGEYGEDITHLFQKIHRETSIPKSLDEEITAQITGEIVAPNSIENARNYAAGALNLKDAEEFYMKQVEFFAYDMQESPFDTYVETLLQLKGWGFITPHTHDTWHVPKDGVVHRINSNKQYKKLGYTSKHPKGAFALKERTEGVETIILDVVWQTGKTGKVTPVAILEPVDIDGATVSRATLNNPGFIEALGVEIGDSVMVERAGGIIPRIIKKAES